MGEAAETWYFGHGSLDRAVCRHTIPMNPRQLFNKTTWVSSNLAANVICMGLLHAPIAHGLGGPHGKELTLFQIATHTLSLWFFLSVLLVAQSKAWKGGSVKLLTPLNFAALLGLVPLMFWTGYYTLYIPFDIFFMYLTIGLVNGWMLKSWAAKPALWMVQMGLSGLCAALAGIAVGLSGYVLLIKNLHGMVMDITLWTVITLPASLAYGFVSRMFIRRQFETRSTTPTLERPIEASLRSGASA